MKVSFNCKRDPASFIWFFFLWLWRQNCQVRRLPRNKLTFLFNQSKKECIKNKYERRCKETALSQFTILSWVMLAIIQFSRSTQREGIHSGKNFCFLDRFKKRKRILQAPRPTLFSCFKLCRCVLSYEQNDSLLQDNLPRSSPFFSIT